ncbi:MULTISPECIES: ABC-three component system protein [unclassified Pseudomonas]|uniref:ABC-three component system protein n=1 Tax=unclassified Pseudomonas TaxID=196821 RepID=UPI000D36DEE7|nr:MULTISPECIES: ABC-three component system protein [unclassified Pseudomonas]RAU45562.1 hypothetical protein DBP26_014020 [Pseudomonas sp. RIT 409]RAU53333.1 hypothetical protein DBY65_015725 [Pseudomonas sp. RIT 412]
MRDPEGSASAAGYGYQYERALYRIYTAPNAQTWFGIETADDVEEISQTSSGSRRVSEQAKLSVQPRKNPLQDSSQNLWKTLRIWLAGMAEARLKYDHLEYLLVTNKVLKKGTLVMRLSEAQSKDEIAQVLIDLRTQAHGMTGKGGEIAKEVAAYSDADLEFLIGHMRVEDGQFNAQMKERIISSLHLPEDALACSESIYSGLVGFLFTQCQETWKSRGQFWTCAQPFYNHRQALVNRFLDGPWEPMPFEETKFAEWAEKIDPSDMRFMAQLDKLSVPGDLLMEQFSYFCAAYSERVRLLESGRVLLSDFDKAEGVLSDRWKSIGSAHRIVSSKTLDQFDISDYNAVLAKTLFPETFPMKVGRMSSSAKYLFCGTYHRMANAVETLSPIHWHRDVSAGDA